MRNYLILREKVQAFRADPEVQAALAAARLPELAVPTLARGRGLAELLDEAAPGRGGARRRAAPAIEHLDQLALEHLYGVR